MVGPVEIRQRRNARFGAVLCRIGQQRVANTRRHDELGGIGRRERVVAVDVCEPPCLGTRSDALPRKLCPGVVARPPDCRLSRSWWREGRLLLGGRSERRVDVQRVGSRARARGRRPCVRQRRALGLGRNRRLGEGVEEGIELLDVFCQLARVSQERQVA